MFAQQCNLDYFNDGVSSSTPQAYYCYCNDRDGCNKTSHAAYSDFYLIFVLMILINFFKNTLSI